MNIQLLAVVVLTCASDCFIIASNTTAVKLVIEDFLLYYDENDESWEQYVYVPFFTQNKQL